MISSTPASSTTTLLDRTRPLVPQGSGFGPGLPPKRTRPASKTHPETHHTSHIFMPFTVWKKQIFATRPLFSDWHDISPGVEENLKMLFIRYLRHRRAMMDRMMDRIITVMDRWPLAIVVITVT